MKIFWIALGGLLLAGLIVWVRGGSAPFNVLHALPLLGGHKPSLLWDGAAFVMVLIVLWGLRRLRSGH